MTRKDERQGRVRQRVILRVLSAESGLNLHTSCCFWVFLYHATHVKEAARLQIAASPFLLQTETPRNRRGKTERVGNRDFALHFNGIPALTLAEVELVHVEVMLDVAVVSPTFSHRSDQTLIIGARRDQNVLGLRAVNGHTGRTNQSKQPDDSLEVCWS